MKKLLIISIFSIYGFSNIVDKKVDENLTRAVEENKQVIANSLVKEYQDMFEKIGEQRVGLDKADIEKVKAPFLKIVKKKKVEDGDIAKKEVKKLPPLILEAILGKSARINGTWYKLHQKIRDAKIVSITNSGVLIKSVTYKKKLTLRNSNANISIK